MRQRPDQLSARETNLAPVLARASEALLRALTDLKAAGYQEGQTEFVAAVAGARQDHSGKGTVIEVVNAAVPARCRACGAAKNSARPSLSHIVSP